MGLSLEWFCPGMCVYVCVCGRRIGSAEACVGAAWQRGLSDDLTRARVIQPKCTLWLLRAGAGPGLVVDPIRRLTIRAISRLVNMVMPTDHSRPCQLLWCAPVPSIHPLTPYITYVSIHRPIDRAAGHGRAALVLLRLLQAGAP